MLKRNIATLIKWQMRWRYFGTFSLTWDALFFQKSLTRFLKQLDFYGLPRIFLKSKGSFTKVFENLTVTFTLRYLKPLIMKETKRMKLATISFEKISSGQLQELNARFSKRIYEKSKSWIRHREVGTILSFIWWRSGVRRMLIFPTKKAKIFTSSRYLCIDQNRKGPFHCDSSCTVVIRNWWHEKSLETWRH